MSRAHVVPCLFAGALLACTSGGDSPSEFGAQNGRVPSGARCSPSESVTCACPGTRATGMQTCEADGVAFSACAGCPPPDDALPDSDAMLPDRHATELDAGAASCVQGTARTMPCGHDGGRQLQLCERGHWLEQGQCLTPRACVDGGEREVACGLNARGSLPESCTHGAWAASGPCEDPDECTDNALRDRACGRNGRGTQTERCTAGYWADEGSCADPDECIDAAERSVACGIRALDFQRQICTEGAWEDFGVCECSAPSTREVPCGLNGRGTQAQSCQSAGWSDVGACADSDECVDGAISGDVCVLICTRGSWVVHSCDVTRVSVGAYHQCAVREHGQVYCWGDGDHGKLGNGSTADVQQPTPVIGLNTAIAVTAGYSHTCALVQGIFFGDPPVVCWGAGGLGQLGNGGTADQLTPVAVTGLTGAVAISTGESHTCALLATGRVACWGSGYDGQLGNGGTSDQTTPVEVSDVEDAVAVSAGGTHTCALRTTGQVTCWGDGRSTPEELDLGDVLAISAGGDHTCALRTTRDLYCWGRNDYGQLGGYYGDPGVDNVIAVSAGDEHTCAVVESGEVFCWGRGKWGRLGTGDANDQQYPARVSGLSGAATVSAGGNGACALRSDGQVACWGYFGDYGEQFDGTSREERPVEVKALVGSLSVGAGGNHSCAAIDADGGTACWGRGTAGQLGHGDNPSIQARPVVVAGLIDTIALEAGQEHTCALRENGRVVCWGSGALGQLGNGATQSHNVPIGVAGLSGVSALSLGDFHTCAVAGGAAVCWGAGGSGQLGTGDHDSAASPTPVAGLTGVVTAIGAGSSHTCLVLETGEVFCWGDGYLGQLGNGDDTSEQTLPVAVTGLSDAITVGAGAYHSCALRETGQVACWGNGTSGQLGNGSTDSHTTPVTVTGLSDALELSVGSDHACARRATNQVVCWGSGADGRLGSGTFSNQSTPVTVSYINDAVTIAVGGAHSCALRASGRVNCWGAGVDGQLGNGPPWSPTPVFVSWPGD